MTPTPNEAQQPPHEDHSIRDSQSTDEVPTSQVSMAMPIDTKKGPLVHLLTLPATRRWGMMVIGLLLAIGGGILIYSATSQLSVYQNSLAKYRTIRGTIQNTFISISIAQGEGDYYAVMNNSTVIYNIGSNENFPTSTQFPDPGADVSFTYRSDEPININRDFGNGQSLQGTGYQVAQFTVYDSSGQSPKVFASSDYAQIMPNISNAQAKRNIGIALLIIGLIIVALVFVVPAIRGRPDKNKKQTLPNLTSSVQQ